MRDSRAAVIIFPSDPQHAEPAPPPGRYVIRCCRAVALVALGAAMHVVLPDRAVPVVPVITPLRFMAPTPGPGTRRVVVERSTVVARPLELDDMRRRRENSRPFPAIGDVPITRSVSLTGAGAPAAPVATAGQSETAEVSAGDERATVAAAEVVSVEPANRVDGGNARPDTFTTGADAVKAVNEPLAAANPIVAPIAAPAVREAAHVISEEELVRRLLDEYAGAYERLDVGAAKAVWPTVDGKALKRAFAQLSAQRVTLQSCGITISGLTANARCQGSATYQPRIGSRPVQIASREWTFDLSKQDTNWRIVNTLVR